MRAETVATTRAKGFGVTASSRLGFAAIDQVRTAGLLGSRSATQRMLDSGGTARRLCDTGRFAQRVVREDTIAAHQATLDRFVGFGAVRAGGRPLSPSIQRLAAQVAESFRPMTKVRTLSSMRFDQPTIRASESIRSIKWLGSQRVGARAAEALMPATTIRTFAPGLKLGELAAAQLHGTLSVFGPRGFTDEALATRIVRSRAFEEATAQLGGAVALRNTGAAGLRLAEQMRARGLFEIQPGSPLSNRMRDSSFLTAVSGPVATDAEVATLLRSVVELLQAQARDGAEALRLGRGNLHWQMLAVFLAAVTLYAALHESPPTMETCTRLAVRTPAHKGLPRGASSAVTAETCTTAKP